MEMQFRTNLNCQSCVAKVKPYLDGEPTIKEWSVDTKDARKILTVSGDRIDPKMIESKVAQSGFLVLEKISPDTMAPVSAETYKPLILILFYLLGGVCLLQLQTGFNLTVAMMNFMGGFFLIFSFFKFLNLKKFAEAYATYDVVAKKWPGYGFLYPFLELFLGIAYVSGVYPFETNVFALILMSVSSIGVTMALVNKKAIACACLGTVFNLPMTKVTLFEDLLMAFMALAMIVL